MPITFSCITRALFSVAAIVLITACEGLAGPMGPQGENGADLWVRITEGTIFNDNYRPGNSHAAAIPVGSSLGDEPTILFLGIQNEYGVYDRIDFAAVIWAGSDEDYAVPGTEGWYVLTNDLNKDLVGSNYRVKFLQ